MAQKVKLLFSNLAYRATVYKTGALAVVILNWLIFTIEITPLPSFTFYCFRLSE